MRSERKRARTLAKPADESLAKAVLETLCTTTDCGRGWTVVAGRDPMLVIRPLRRHAFRLVLHFERAGTSAGKSSKSWQVRMVACKCDSLRGPEAPDIPLVLARHAQRRLFPKAKALEVRLLTPPAAAAAETDTSAPSLPSSVWECGAVLTSSLATDTGATGSTGIGKALQALLQRVTAPETADSDATASASTAVDAADVVDGTEAELVDAGLKALGQATTALLSGIRGSAWHSVVTPWTGVTAGGSSRSSGDDGGSVAMNAVKDLGAAVESDAALLPGLTRLLITAPGDESRVRGVVVLIWAAGDAPETGALAAQELVSAGPNMLRRLALVVAITALVLLAVLWAICPTPTQDAADAGEVDPSLAGVLPRICHAATFSGALSMRTVAVSAAVLLLVVAFFQRACKAATGRKRKAA
jgi:hypothetical protein